MNQNNTYFFDVLFRFYKQLCFELSKPISRADALAIREAKMAGKPIPPKKIVYCSVREFTADENIAILPNWVCIIL